MLNNRIRTLDYMRRFELDAIVATSPLNITYFSDYYFWADTLFKEYMMRPGASSQLSQSYVLFPLDGQPSLVVNPFLAVNAVDLPVDDLHVYGSAPLDTTLADADVEESHERFKNLLQRQSPNATPTDALLSVLEQQGLSGARIGLEQEGLPGVIKNQIRQSLPHAEIKDCTNLIRLIRMVKSSEEIDRLTRAGEITEVAAMESLALAKPGQSISELIAHFRSRIAQDSADFDHYAYGRSGYGIATEPDYLLLPDDVLYVDFGCVYRNYFSDAGTTLTLSEPIAELQTRYAALSDCIEAGESQLKPGVKSSTVFHAMNKVLAGQGICAWNAHGHGLGLEMRDYPIVVADNQLQIRDDCVDISSDLELETGMVINLEACIFMPDVGSLHIERSLLLTSAGNQPLFPHERTAPVNPVE